MAICLEGKCSQLWVCAAFDLSTQDNLLQAFSHGTWLLFTYFFIADKKSPAPINRMTNLNLRPAVLCRLSRQR